MSTPSKSRPNVSRFSNWHTKLRQILENYFDENDIETLCFDLRFDYQSLAGVGKTRKIVELIKGFARLGRIGELIDYCSQQRPNISWAELREAAIRNPLAVDSEPDEGLAGSTPYRQKTESRPSKRSNSSYVAAIGCVGVALVVVVGLVVVIPLIRLPTLFPSVDLTPALAPTEPGAPVVGLWSVTPAQLTEGQTVTIQWTVTGAESVELEGFGTVESSGQRTDKPRQTKTYTLTASNKGKTTKKVQEVVVVPAAPAPDVAATAAANATQAAATQAAQASQQAAQATGQAIAAQQAAQATRQAMATQQAAQATRQAMATQQAAQATAQAIAALIGAMKEEYVDKPPNVYAEQGMHACPAGYAIGGMDPYKNWFLCRRVMLRGEEQFVVTVLDSGATLTVRANMHACPRGMYMRGLHLANNLLLCSYDSRIGPKEWGQEFQDSSSRGNDMHICPRPSADGVSYMTGIHAVENRFLCNTRVP